MALGKIKTILTLFLVSNITVLGIYECLVLFI